MRTLDALLVLALLGGCSTSDADPGVTGGAAEDAAESGDAAAGAGGASPSTGGSGGDNGGSGGTNAPQGGSGGSAGSAGSAGNSAAGHDAATVCARWKADRAAGAEGAWDGDAASCHEGTLAAPGAENTVRRVNLYRWLAGLPEVTHNPSMSVGAQQCAVMMHANDDLDHYPPETWKCYTPEGASAASVSLLATMPSVSGIDLFMLDLSSPYSMGHRRNILGDGLEEVGVGSTDEYSCLRTVDAIFVPGQDVTFTAWPPPGAVPFEAFDPLDYFSLDIAGWTVQTNKFELKGAKVQVTENGAVKPVQASALQDYMGNYYALRFKPNGWEAAPGHTYHVSVTSVGQPIEYDVEVVDCE